MKGANSSSKCLAPFDFELYSSKKLHLLQTSERDWRKGQKGWYEMRAEPNLFRLLYLYYYTMFILVHHIYIFIYSFYKVETVEDSLKLTNTKKYLFKTQKYFHLIMRVQDGKSKGEKTENLSVVL